MKITNSMRKKIDQVREDKKGKRIRVFGTQENNAQNMRKHDIQEIVVEPTGTPKNTNDRVMNNRRVNSARRKQRIHLNGLGFAVPHRVALAKFLLGTRKFKANESLNNLPKFKAVTTEYSMTKDEVMQELNKQGIHAVYSGKTRTFFIQNKVREGMEDVKEHLQPILNDLMVITLGFNFKVSEAA